MVSLVSISDDQSSQIDSATKINEKQHVRVAEASLLEAIVTDDNNISIVNNGNTDTEILEIRVLDDNGNVILKEILTEPILASRVTEMITSSDIKEYIRNMISANKTR